jgi:transcriptional regulator with XRE-family HTH domain
MQRAFRTVDYPECGLEHVILHNVPVWECDNGHRDVQVPAVELLHRLLAETVVSQPMPLSGKDIRFLRKYSGFSARAFSERVGLSHITLSRMENAHRRIPRKLDALVRLFFGTVLAEQLQRPLPRSVIRALEYLEQTALDLAPREFQHVELGGAGIVAEPRSAWQEAR